MRHQRFTLIEMLVVISIIGILSALLSGPIMRSVASARRTSCLNNLKQAGYAVQIYRTANNQFPWAANWAGTVYTENSTVFPYPPISSALKNQTSPEIFRCPSDNQEYYEKSGSSYEWNARLSGQSGEPRGFGGRALKASYVPILWDYEAFHGTMSTAAEKVSVGGDVEEVEVRSSGDGARNILYLDNSANPL